MLNYASQDFRPYDHLRQLFADAKDIGWLEGADLPSFFNGLYSVASLYVNIHAYMQVDPFGTVN